MTTNMSDIAGLEGGRVTLTPEQFDELEARVDGPVLRAGDEGWDDAVLVWNGMVAVVPALVLQPTSAHDGAAALGFALDHGLFARPFRPWIRATWERLRHENDPDNLFRANRNIRPGT